MQTITILQTSFEVLKVNSLKVIVCSHSLSSQSILYMCPIDGFQMSIKRPTSGRQARAQEAAVQQIFHLERSSFFYLSALMVRTQRSAYEPVFCTQLC